MPIFWFLWCVGFLAFYIHVEQYAIAAALAGVSAFWLVVIAKEY